jgi:hypothetical protein
MTVPTGGANNKKARQQLLLQSLGKLQALAHSRPAPAATEVVKQYPLKAAKKSKSKSKKKSKKAKPKAGEKNEKRSEHTSESDEESDDAWLAAIAEFMEKDKATVAALCPALDASLLQSYVVYCQSDGIHFMQVTSYYSPPKRGNYNFELAMMFGEDVGKRLDYSLRTEFYSLDPIAAVGQWGLVLLTGEE